MSLHLYPHLLLFLSLRTDGTFGTWHGGIIAQIIAMILAPLVARFRERFSPPLSAQKLTLQADVTIISSTAEDEDFEFVSTQVLPAA